MRGECENRGVALPRLAEVMRNLAVRNDSARYWLVRDHSGLHGQPLKEGLKDGSSMKFVSFAHEGVEMKPFTSSRGKKRDVYQMGAGLRADDPSVDIVRPLRLENVHQADRHSRDERDRTKRGKSRVGSTIGRPTPKPR